MIYNLFSFSNNPISIKLCDKENIYNDIRTCARIVYVLNGEVSIHYHNKDYIITSDNLIYINPHTFHDIYGDNGKFLLIHIEYSYYDKTVIPTIPYIDCNSLTIKEGEDNDILLLKNIIARFVQVSTFAENADQILSKSLSYELLSCLVSHFKVDDISESKVKSKNTVIEGVLQYVSDNYNNDISLSSLADHFHFTIPYMSKLFKQEVGTTFLNYLQDIRLRYVKSDLSRRKMSAEELAEKHGFPNSRSLLSSFKNRLGISFVDYKKSLESKQSNPDDFMSENMSSDLNILSKYLNNNKSRVNDIRRSVIEIPEINIGQTRNKYNRSHSYQIGVGYAKDLLDPFNQKMIKEAIKEIGFKYISFHGIFDDEMMVYTEDDFGEPTHSFWFVERVISFILSTGAKPIIELSYMPSALAEDSKRKMFQNRSCVSIPKDFNKWGNLVYDLFANLCLLYGKDEVSTWPIQVWSFPDLIGDFSKVGPSKYIELYKTSVNAIRKIIPEPIIEFPKITFETLNKTEHISQYFNEMISIYPPKAVNMGFYGIKAVNIPSKNVQTTRKIVLAENETFLEEVIAAAKKSLKELNLDYLPLRISEWNSSLSHRNLVNDTAYKTAYIVRNVIQNYDNVDSFGYWTLFDINETQPPKHTFHGGLGLYTRNGIKKSAYYGFYILSHLGNELICKGKGYAIFAKGDVIQVLLYNYHNINKLYAQGEMFNMSLTNRYSAFTQPTDIKFFLNLEGFENGEYQLDKTIINVENSSSYDKWIKMGAPEIMTQEVEDNIKALISPLKKYKKEIIDDHKIQLSPVLSPHEVCLIEIKKVFQSKKNQ